jgi:hypothetical protein
MNPLRCFRITAGVLVAGFVLPCAAVGEVERSPLAFFEGDTERLSMVRVLMRKPYRSRTVGYGTIQPDGTLNLIQTTFEQGKPVKTRRWNIRQVSPTRFLGSMTEAASPVRVDLVGSRFRFQLKLRGDLSVEEWLTPLADGKTVRTRTTIRKWGVQVASSEGIIRRP